MDTEDTAAAPAAQTPVATPPAAGVDKPAAAKPEAIGDKFAALKARAHQTPAAPKGADPAKPAAAAPEKKESDPDIAAVERILKEDARVKAEAKKVAAERAAAAAERAAWEAEKTKERETLEAARAARAAREKGDVIGMLRAHGLTDADIYEGDTSILFKLAEARSQAPAVDEKTRFEAVVAEKLAEKEAAEKAAADTKAKEEKEKLDKEQAEAKAVIEEAQENYSKSVHAIVAANPEKYRALIKHQIPAGVVTKYAWNTLMNTKGETQLSEEEALADLEEYYRKLAKEVVTPEEKKEDAPIAQQPQRGIRVNPDAQSRTPTPAAPPATSLKDKYAQLKQKARATATK